MSCGVATVSPEGGTAAARDARATGPRVRAMSVLREISPVWVSEGDLNPDLGAISPDRGNHAIRVTWLRRTHSGTQLRIRYLFFCLS
jgi:hypothetical protein